MVWDPSCKVLGVAAAEVYLYYAPICIDISKRKEPPRYEAKRAILMVS